jgi:hypothetical protein
MNHTTDCTREQVAQFTSAIFDADDIVEVRRLPSGASTWHLAGELADHVEAFRKDNRQNHIFFGANPRTARGQTKDIAYAQCLFADFDNNTTPSEALERIDQSGLPRPSVIINSVHGTHCYWRLPDRIDDLQQWTQHQKGIIQLLGSDRAIHDPPRLMRLPGFTNIKAPVAQCDLIECEPDRVYDLDALVVKLPEPQHRPEPSARKTLENKDFASTCDTLSRAVRYARKWPPAPVGERHHTTFRHAAQLVHDFGLSADAALPLLAAWNETNADPLPQTEVAKCLRDAGEYGGKPEHVKPKVGAPISPLPGWYTLPQIGDSEHYKSGLPAVTTGYSVLDAALSGGFRPCSTYILAARTGGAKSTLAANIARRAALSGVNTLLVKIEESASEILWRIHAACANVPLKRFLDGLRLTIAKERERLAEAWDILRNLPLRISDARPLGDILRLIGEHAQAGGQLVIVDQLSGLVIPDSKNAFESATTASNALRDAAVSDRLAILTVVQVNRLAAVTGRADKPRRLDCFDLRDSGHLENDSAGVLLIDRAKRIEKPGGRAEYELQLLVAKNRYGPITRDDDEPIILLWEPATMRIDEYGASLGGDE